ncbi:Predicted dehydrogenase [Rhizobiales bacterium GAS191]|nr:Predicted dehydrogenase [Rhizobiales bacterium GAS191]
MEQSLIEAFGRRVRIGMVGGGADSVIGNTHLLAMRVDGLCELVAGAMSIDPIIAIASGRHELIARDRTYTDYRDMAEKEAARYDRIDAVVIATPPRLHFPVAKAFLDKGIDVICEKPMTHDLAEARALVDLVRQRGRLFCLTHCYTGYPMVREARAMVKAGAIGKVRLIDAEFSIGVPGVALEPDDPATRHWRFRVDQEGKAGLLGEAGSHAYHMACYITGLAAEQVSALMATYAPRREVYDNAYITVRFNSGAQGRLWYSYVAAGNDHGLTIKIFGETGSLIWWQEEGEVLWHKPMGRPARRIARGYDDQSPDAVSATRVRAGHPEGYLMAFATLYKEFAQAIMARSLSRPHQPYMTALPTVEDGANGMALIEAATLSNEQGSRWVECPSPVPTAAALAALK